MLATRRIQPHGGAAFDAVGTAGSAVPPNGTALIHGNCAVLWVMTYAYQPVATLVLGGTTYLASGSPTTPLCKTAIVKDNNNTGGIQAIAILGAPKGSQPYSLNFATNPTYAYSQAVSYYNIGEIGTIVTAFGTNAPSMSGLVYPSGAVMAQGFGGYALGSLAFSSPKFTQRVSNSQGSTILMIAGDQTAAHAAANGTSATTNNAGGYWGGVSIPLLAA